MYLKGKMTERKLELHPSYFDMVCGDANGSLTHGSTMEQHGITLIQC